eukprot:TRINITY_DN8690_c0_g1_i2.p1 TRINITY_DN8690_c0_g1~~TRINITY_DN8690_c0_g1_i2.p1  ORF type:complete len:4324 (+),score=928.29 TRINITY_DN8690_c0_g1_i2:1039-12972(+)
MPSSIPTASPTHTPSAIPTNHPTEDPSATPTQHPTQGPSGTPTQHPTQDPTQGPSATPTQHPTQDPSATSNQHPTQGPSASPTKHATEAEAPSVNPTSRPTEDPSAPPTKGPTVVPAVFPSPPPPAIPSSPPTHVPTPLPSSSSAPPTVPPTITALPPEISTVAPTAPPTSAPGTTLPTPTPSQPPSTAALSSSPSALPTARPTIAPASGTPDSPGPTGVPSAAPSLSPSSGPSAAPSASPTAAPSITNISFGTVHATVHIATDIETVSSAWVDQLQCDLAVAAGAAGCGAVLIRSMRPASLTVDIIIVATQAGEVDPLHDNLAQSLRDPESPFRMKYTIVAWEIADVRNTIEFLVYDVNEVPGATAQLKSTLNSILEGTDTPQAELSTVLVHYVDGTHFVVVSISHLPPSVGAAEAMDRLFQAGGRLAPAYAPVTFPVVGVGLDPAALDNASATELAAFTSALGDTIAHHWGIPARNVRVWPPSPDGEINITALLPRGSSPAALGARLHVPITPTPALLASGALQGLFFDIWRDELVLRLHGLPPGWPPTGDALTATTRALAAELDAAMRPAGCASPATGACGWSANISLPGAQSAAHPEDVLMTAIIPPGDVSALADALQDLPLPETARAFAEATGSPLQGLSTDPDAPPHSRPHIVSWPEVICEGGGAELHAARPLFGTGRWGPSKFEYIPSDTSPDVLVRGLPIGRVTELTWSVNDGLGKLRAVKVSVSVSNVRRPRARVHTPALTITAIDAMGSRVLLCADPAPAGSTARWWAAGAATVEDPSAPCTNVTALVLGPNEFVWEVFAPVCVPSTSSARSMVTVVSSCSQERCGAHGRCVSGQHGPWCLCDASDATGHWAWSPALARSECPVCAVGWAGSSCTEPLCSAANCPAERGACADDSSCRCAERFAGPQCSACSPRFAGGGCSLCSPGWYTSDSAEPCAVYCNPWETCGAQGAVPDTSCSPTGQCVCGARRQGPACAECRAPFYGLPGCFGECTPGTTCSGHGCCAGTPECPAAGQAVCRCEADLASGHWASSRADGRGCDVCATGWGPPADCRERLAPTCIPGESCLHGSCLGGRFAQCTCSASHRGGFWDGPRCDYCARGWAGKECARCAQGFYGAFCNVSCDCGFAHAHGCNADGVCVCHRDMVNGYWGGEQCGRCCTVRDGCGQNFTGTECMVPVCSDELGTCGSHGRCAGNECECYTDAVRGYWGGTFCRECLASRTLGHWAGTQTGCQTCREWWYPAGVCNVPCSPTEDCSGHGSCTANGTCACSHGWTGDDCSDCTEEGAGLTVPCGASGTVECPVEATAELSASRGEVTVRFAAATDGVQVPRSCLALFSSASYARLGGAGALCSFPDNATLRVVTGPLAARVAPLQPGDVLQLRQVLRPWRRPECLPFRVSPVLSVLAEPPPPRVSLVGLTAVGPCHDATVSAVITVGMTRRQIEWGAAAPGVQSAALAQAAAGAAGSERLVLQRLVLREVLGLSVLVTVRVTDDLGAMARAEHTLQVLPAPPPGLISSTPTAVAADFSRDITLRVQLASSVCAASDQGSAELVNWYLGSPSGEWLASGLTMVIPAASLRGEWNAQGDLVPHQFSAQEQSGALVTFNVQPAYADPVARIRGSSTLGLDPRVPLLLTVDVADPMNAPRTAWVRWACRAAGGSEGRCDGRAGPPGEQSVSLPARIEPRALGVTWRGELRVTAAVRIGQRRGVASQEYTFASESNAVVAPIAVYIDAGDSLNGAVYPYRRVILNTRGFVPPLGASVSYQWECTSGNLDLKNSLVAPLGAAGPSLLLSGRGLVPEALFQIAVLVRYSGAAGGQGYAQVSLTTNSAPCCGSLVTDPVVVRAPLRTVLLRAVGWTPPMGGGSLQYQFLAENAHGQRRVVSEWSPTTWVSLVVPVPAEPGDAAPLTFVLQVRDAVLFTTYEVTTAVVVLSDAAAAQSMTISQFFSATGVIAEGVDFGSASNAAVSLYSVEPEDCASKAQELVSTFLSDPRSAGERGQAAQIVRGTAVCIDGQRAWRSTSLSETLTELAIQSISTVAPGQELGSSPTLIPAATDGDTAAALLEAARLGVRSIHDGEATPEEELPSVVEEDPAPSSEWDTWLRIAEDLALRHMIPAADGEFREVASEDGALRINCVRTRRGDGLSGHPEGLRWDSAPVNAEDSDSATSLCSVAWPGNPISALFPNATSLSDLKQHFAGTTSGYLMRIAEDTANHTFDFPIKMTRNLTEAELEAFNLTAHDQLRVWCAWWDYEASDWSRAGCDTLWDNATRSATCVCTHLTEYALIPGVGPLPDVKKIVSRIIAARFNPAEANLLAVGILGSFALLAAVGVGIAAVWAHGEHRRQILRELQSDNTLAPNMLHQVRWIGAAMPASHRDAITRPLAQDPRITEYHSILGRRWLVARASELFGRVSAEHPWLRPFNANVGHFDAPRRLSVLLCLLAGLLLVSAALFRSVADATITLTEKIVFLLATVISAGLLTRLISTAAGYFLIRSERSLPDDLSLQMQLQAKRRANASPEGADWWELGSSTSGSPAAARPGLLADRAGVTPLTLIGNRDTTSQTSAPGRAQWEKAAGLLATFDEDTDGALSLSEFNAYLRTLHPKAFERSGRWSAQVFNQLLTDLGSRSTDRMDVDAFLRFHQFPGSPAFRSLEHHFRTVALTVEWTDPERAETVTLSATEGGSGQVYCSVAGRRPAATRSIIFDRATSRLQLISAGVTVSLPRDGDSAPGVPCPAATRVLRRICYIAHFAGVRQNIPCGGLPPQTSSPEELVESTRFMLKQQPPGLPHERSSQGSPQPPEFPYRTMTPQSDPLAEQESCLSPPLPDAPPNSYGSDPDDAHGALPAPVGLGAAVKEAVLADAEETRSVEQLGNTARRVRFGTRSTPSSETVSAPSKHPERGGFGTPPEDELLPLSPRDWNALCRRASQTASLPSRGGTLRHGRHPSRRRSRALSLGSDRIIAAAGEGELQELQQKDPLSAWEALCGQARGEPIPLAQMEEILRGEYACNRALCTLAVAHCIAARGGAVPALGHAAGDPGSGSTLTVRRLPDRPFGLIVGRDMEVLDAAPGTAARAAKLHDFKGRRVLSVDGRPATLQRLREADAAGRDVKLTFSDAAPRVGDTVTLAHPRAGGGGGCLRPDGRGAVKLTRQEDDGTARALVERQLRGRVFESWYPVSALKVVPLGEVQEGVQRTQSTVSLHTNATEMREVAQEVDIIAGIHFTELEGASEESSEASWSGTSVGALIEALERGAHTDSPLALFFDEFLWHRDANRAAWRVGVELVLEGRFGLAAAVFEVVPLLLNPDLFFALHPVQSVRGTLTLAGVVGLAACSPSFGKMWVRYYALGQLGDGPWLSADWRCPSCEAREAGPFVTAVLGLQDCYAPHAGFGGASFHLQVEDSIDPNWVSFEALVREGRLLEAAHVGRMLRTANSNLPAECVHTPVRASRAKPVVRCSEVLEQAALRPGRHGISRRKRAAPYCGFHPRALFHSSRQRVCGDRVLNSCLEPLFGEQRTQPSFYHTIEYGRLLALTMAERRLELPLLAAVTAMLRQERRAVLRRDMCGLAFRSTEDADPEGSCMRGLRSDVWSFPGAERDPSLDHASGTPNNNICAADYFRPNAYLSALLCARINADGSQRTSRDQAQSYALRFVMPNHPVDPIAAEYGSDSIWGRLPFRQLGKYLYPAAGSGLALNPHRGLQAALGSARVGDSVVLLSGTYAPCRVEGIVGTAQHPLLIVGEGAIGGAGDVRAAVLRSRRQKAAALAGIAHCLPGDAEVPVFRPPPQRNPYALLSLMSCKHIQIAHVRFRGDARMPVVGINMASSSDIQVSQCSFFGKCEAFRLGQWTAAQEKVLYEQNFFDTKSEPKGFLAQKLHECDRAQFSSRMACVGYSIAAVLFVGLIMLSVFITAGFTRNETIEWGIRAIGTLVFDVVILQPTLIVLRAAIEKLSSGDVATGGADFATDAMADFTMA